MKVILKMIVEMVYYNDGRKVEGEWKDDKAI